MPFTARLSRRFYEKFGDEIVKELVDLLNHVDLTYRTELREQNELNYARFEAKLEQRIAELRAELIAAIGGLRADMHALKAELIKWMFLFWVVSVLGGYLFR